MCVHPKKKEQCSPQINSVIFHTLSDFFHCKYLLCWYLKTLQMILLTVSGNYGLPFCGRSFWEPCPPWGFLLTPEDSLCLCSLKLSVSLPNVVFFFSHCYTLHLSVWNHSSCDSEVWGLSLQTCLLIWEQLEGKSCSLWCSWCHRVEYCVFTE